ncbi:unnamed protein product [Spirodela intermedia]|uniref:C3H1-type domain-containing protein n=1 Tax=Spirodela intermedia TaxID=51605 RepID=A0A7I8KL95_SPIIN|nr:unnamed protein product [Spirodela intermedia]
MEQHHPGRLIYLTKKAQPFSEINLRLPLSRVRQLSPLPFTLSNRRSRRNQRLPFFPASLLHSFLLPDAPFFPPSSLGTPSPLRSPSAIPFPGVYRPRGGTHNIATRKTCRFWLQGRCSRIPCPFLHCGNPQLLGVEERAPKNQPRRSLIWRNPDAARPSTPPASPHRPLAADGSGRRKWTKNGDPEAKRPSAPDTDAHACPFEDPPPPPPPQSSRRQRRHLGLRRRTWPSPRCNSSSERGLSLLGTGSEVSTLGTTTEILLAGLEDERGDGVRFQPVGSLRGHASDVTSLAVGNGRLYSGTPDGSIRAWNVPSMETVDEFESLSAAHGGAVTSLLCWWEFLLSASLDGTVKVCREAERTGGSGWRRFTATVSTKASSSTAQLTATAGRSSCARSATAPSICSICPVSATGAGSSAEAKVRAMQSAGSDGFFVGNAVETLASTRNPREPRSRIRSQKVIGYTGPV